MTLSAPTISIRPATAADGPAITRLAALDSADAPFGPVLLAEVDGNLRAAPGARDGRVVADPFARTAELVDLLRVQARRLAPARRRAIGLPALGRRAQVALHG